MKYLLDRSSHSVYSLNYHLIFCTKYRRNVLTDKISERLKDIITNISKEFHTNIIEQETDKDHVHVLFKSKPILNITKFINSVKGVASRLLFQEFPEIKLQLWKGHLWSTSYCLLTTGQTTLDILKRYVESQGKDRKTKNINIIYKPCKICGW
jgi:putative transposase